LLALALDVSFYKLISNDLFDIRLPYLDENNLRYFWDVALHQRCVVDNKLFCSNGASLILVILGLGFGWASN
jgi:hypothetical protein